MVQESSGMSSIVATASGSLAQWGGNENKLKGKKNNSQTLVSTRDSEEHDVIISKVCDGDSNIFTIWSDTKTLTGIGFNKTSLQCFIVWLLFLLLIINIKKLF